MRKSIFTPTPIYSSVSKCSVLLGLLISQLLIPSSVRGGIVAWGNNNNLQTQIPPAANDAANISAGTLHSLALRPDGTVVGWGDNFFGQTNVSANLSNVAAVAAGNS